MLRRLRSGNAQIAVRQDDAAEDHDVAVVQLGLVDAAAVDDRAVRAAVIEDPQPAALMTIVSTLAASKVAIILRASAEACSSRPE